MAITYLSSRGYSNNNGTSVLSQPTGTGISYLASRGKAEEEEKNVGGLVGGIGYLGEKLAVGTVSSIEGISDYTFSGLAKLFGNDAWAEDIIANDWFGDWYSHPEEWFNPGKGWQVAGDVAGGIGTSIPGIAASVGAAIATGGASLAVQGVAIGGASFLTAGLGAAGRATNEAYKQTGQLTGKEYGYGALVGVTEGGIEGLTNIIGIGSGAVVKSFTKAIGKETAEAFTKQGIVKTLGSSFLGEAFEESASEILNPYWQRATYDPNAKNASVDEVLYAGIVGGLSGMVMGGTSYGIDTTKSFISGNRLAQRGGETEVLNTAADFSAFEEKNNTGDELFSEIISRRNELLKSLETTGGKAVRLDQQRDLGALERANVAAASKMFVAKRAQNIVNNADTIAKRLTSYGYKNADGTPITYTADQLTAGYDKTRPQSIYKALSTNSTLRSLAVADATGQLMMDTAQFKQKTLTGERLASQSDLNRFVQQATPEEVSAVSKALKIDSWSGLTAEAFNQKIIDFVNDGGVERSLKTAERKKGFASIPVEQAQPVPRIVNLGKDGVRRYSDGKLDIAVERKGDDYTVYDYNADTLSRGMSKEEVNSVFRDYAKRNAENKSNISAITQESREHQTRIAEIQRFQNEVREVDNFAREHVKEYAKLSEPSKDMVKNIIVQGRSKGISDSDLTMYAKVSAHSGIDIQFDKEATYRGTKADGGADYADGFYEASKNRIVVNPEGKRTAEKLLIHELDHAIRKSFDADGKPATKIYLEAIEGVDQATRDKILKAYKKTATPGDVAATVMDETNAYYAEQVLGNKYTLEKLLEAEPTLKDKILSFFKGASTDYADVPKLSSAAKKYYKTYKKLFDEFSARNAENNALENAHLGSNFEKNTQNISITGANSENMQVSDKRYTVYSNKILDTIKKAIQTKGHLDTAYNQVQISKVTPKIAQMVKAASGGLIDISSKYVALNGSDIWHEYKRHSDSVDETGRRQITITPETMQEAIMAIYDPDIVESIFTTKDNPVQRQSFAYAKQSANGHYVVVEAVGGRKNPNITPVMVLEFNSNKWNSMINSGLTLGEILYEADEEMKSALDVEYNKKNRVTAAQFASNEAIANTPRSPRFNNSISQTEGKSNSFDKKTSDRQDAKQYALKLDEDYMSAVERGDMETAQKMVDEAAKKAGYDSPKLYHGTAAFGFTEFNPELADDGISIFTSNDSLVAETYSGPTRNRNISDRATITPEALESYSAEKLLSLLKKHFSNDYRIVTNAEKQDIVKAIREPLMKTARAVENFYAINMDMFNEKKRESLFAVSKAIKNVANAENYTALTDSHYEYEKVFWDLKWLDESLSDEIQKIIGNSESIAFRELSTWLDTDVFHADAEYTKENGTPWMNRNEAISVLYPKIFSGVYNLYAKTANNLEIDAEGSYWSKIDGRKIGISRELKTRDIAKYAKDKGYNSVVIRNLFDNGSGSYSGMSDVYIFFGSNMLKSADPVTYDDNGNVIPLSERFNERNPDIRYALDIDSDSENISGAEVMSWLNNKPESDGKLDLEATVARGLPYKRGKSELTVGELRKVIANTTHEKVYSKSDALKAVNKLSGTWGLTVKARDEIADTVWQFLNEAPDVEYRQDMAHDIAEYIVAKVLMDSKTENPDALEAAERLSYLRTGIGKLSFTDEDIAELRHAADEKGLKRLMGRWGFKGTKKAEGTSGGYVATRRIPMDIFVTSVAREMPGMEHLEEMHPAEALLEIDRAYSKAYTDSKDKWISRYWDMPDSEIPSMIKDVEDGIMSAFDVFGEKSKFKKQVEAKIESYQKRAEKFKAERDEIKGRDRVLGLLMNQATKMKNLKMGTYANATQHDSDVLRGSVERLSSIQFRGNLNVSGTRNIIAELRLWYNPKNSMLEYVDEQNPGFYSKGISDMLDAIADGEGGFTKEDLLTLYDIMAYFTNFVENYGKVWRKGQWVDAETEAKRYVNTLQTNEQLKVGPVRRLLGSRYMQTFGDPMTVARRMDMHESGFFTEMLEELREGAMGAQVAEMEILEDYDKFLTENRKYIEQTATERIIYQGVEVPKMHLIGLYMTLKRKHSRPGLAQNGFSFYDTDGKKVRVNGFALENDITEAEINKRSEEQLSLIASKLTEKDMEYIKILEKAYNEDARRLKAERDIQRLGFTNAGMGYYYPIRRGNIAKNIDSSDYMAELDRVTNSSFNKNTVRGARQELYIENADIVFRRHVRAVTQYSYLSPAIEAYNRLYNLDVGGNPNQPISVATESANTWDRGNAYFKKLIADIQGIPAVSSEGAELLSKIRGGYAKYQLGANPKVWLTQLSSLFASTSLLDADSIARGASISAEGIDEYCSLAKLRNSENTAAIAQAVLDTRGKKVASGIDRLSDLLMAPIGKMDRFVVGRLFAASQAQIEKNGGAKVGTEENKIAAGKLLTEVILETQQNSIATERSAAMRSGNELLRTATMFSADSMKVTGRVLDKFGESLTLKARIKAETDADKVKVLTERLEKVNKQLSKSMSAMVGSAVYMACVAQLFRHIYNKDKDEDKTTAEIMMADVMGNMIGGLPLVRDVYTKLFEGYDISNYTYSAINDLLDSTSSLFNVAGSIFNGEAGAEEKNRAIRNLINSLGQISGIPTRNAYNVIFGLTKRFSPTTAFAIDSLFYKKNYQTELNKAIERGDSKMASYILGLMMGERLDESMDQTVFNELLALTKAGYKVLPKTMPDSIKIGDVEYLVSDGERAAMQKIYSGYDDAISKLIASKAYGSFTDEEKALAIDYVSDLYYSKAKAEVLGTNEAKAAKLIDVLGADIIASYYVRTREIESDLDAKGNTISGSKRAKIVSAINSLGVSVEQRLLLICASGYALKDGDIRGVSAEAAKTRLLKYILRLRGLTADERLEIAEMCGFEVKNGRIVNNFSKKLQKIAKK